MTSILKFILVFLLLTGATTLLMTYSQVPFGSTNFWNSHGIIFLVFITIFPRLTLLLSSVASGGLLWWLGFFFAPRLLVAALATISYWQINPALVVFSWLIAISGEAGEKSVLRTRIKVVRMGRRRPEPRREENFSQADGDIIEAEFKEIK